MNNYIRQRFDLATDTGVTGIGSTRGDTGPATWGEFRYFHWIPSDGDTGGDLILTMLEEKTDTGLGIDTGSGYEFYNNTDCLGVQFLHAPRLPVVTSGGVGAGDSGQERVMFAGNQLRVRAVAGANEMAGTLWCYFKK